MPAISLTNAKAVEVQKVTLSKITQTEEFIGIIKSKKNAKLLAHSTGVLNIIKQSGEKIKKGDIIAYLDIAEHKENYEYLKSALEIATDQYNRSIKLKESDIINKTQIDEKKNLLIKAKQNFSNIKNILEKNNIRAPFDSTIGTYNGTNSYVNEGDEIVTLYDYDNLLVEFDIPIDIASNINNPSNILILGNIYKLHNIQKIMDQDNLMCKAFVDIECKDCIIGSSVKVILDIIEKKSVIIVPEDSIFLRNNINYVYIVIDNKAIAKHVQLGIRQKNLVEIKHGLDVGDVLIIKAVENLKDNQKIKIMND
jgi:membrane fusion protein (multidrug efflux system)